MAAIYTPLWPLEIYLTTTLYPVETIDELQFNIQLSYGVMELLPYSEITNTFILLDSTYIQKRWFYVDGVYESHITNTFTLLDSTYIQLRWFYVDGPYESEIENTFVFLDGTLINKLVEADSPDEKLQLDVVINNTCTMSPV